MLATTADLITYLQQEENRPNFIVIRSMVHSILCCGSSADAEALLPHFLSRPDDLNYSALLPVLMQHGNSKVAETLYHSSTESQRLKPGVDEMVLQVLGALQYEPCRPMLVYYALEQEPYDYYLNMHAVLGLLYMNVSDLTPAIQNSIENCYGQSLFPEYVPALVGKLPQTLQQSILPKLFELGETTASTDCLGGIVLGFSLCGAVGEAYFWKAFFTPHWEMGMTGTGLRQNTFTALNNLQISFQQLYQKVKTLEKTLQPYGLEMLLAMLAQKVEEPLHLNSSESITDIYTTLFGWKSSEESNNLSNLADRLNKREEADRIENLLELKMREEMMLKNFLTPKA